MPLSSFRQAVLERKIELAVYTIKMVGRCISQLERGRRDTTLARRYLDETIKYLAELRCERMQTARSGDRSEYTPAATPRSTQGSGIHFH
jgi:hypothetical protein